MEESRLKRWLARSWFREIGEPRAKERGGIIRADPNDWTSGIFLSSRSDGGGGDSFWPGKNGSATSAEFLAESSIPYAAQTIANLSLSLLLILSCLSRWRCFQFIRNRETSGRWSFVKLISKEFSSYFDSLENYLCESIHFWKISPFNCTPGMLSWVSLAIKVKIFEKEKKKERKGGRW